MRNCPKSSGSSYSIERNSLVLKRLIRYCEAVYGLSEQIIAGVKDPRREPRIAVSVLLKASLVMFWSRLGSLNALDEHRASHFWKHWLGRSPGSADTMGRVHAGIAADDLRQGLHHLYSRLKRNKALPSMGGLDVAVLDGHETHTSYRRHCSGCLERTIHTEHGDQTQYYHRHVTLQLLTGSDLRLLLDLEPQRSGEDEVTTALRLLNRILPSYPRAFGLLLADGLYAQAPFINLLLAHGKHALVVLKDERRDLYHDACGLFTVTPRQEGKYRSRRCGWWDVPDSGGYRSCDNMLPVSAMFRDPEKLADDLDTLEEIERASMRLVAQALVNSKEQAKEIFASWDDLAGDIGEDITRYAVDALGVSQIPLRIPGKVDYKRARYVFHPSYAVRQALLIDSKAEKAQTAARIQTSQTSMRILRRTRAGQVVDVAGELPQVLTTSAGEKFLTTTIFIKYFYDVRGSAKVLRNIRIACVPNAMLQQRYNPSPSDTIWIAGPHAPSLGEAFRARLSFSLLRARAPWRVQDIPINPETPFVWAD